MSKTSRMKEHAAMLARFPKGSGKGDPLAYQVNLGSSYRQIDSLQFGKAPKASNIKRWGKV